MSETLTLERFSPVRHYATTVKDFERLRGVFIDTETTGLDPEVDKIIQLSIVPFTFSKEGVICTTDDAFIQYEDPGVPLSPEIQRLTGLTDSQLLGHKFSEVLTSTMLEDPAIVICHNAEFDRPFLERRFPIFETLRFGCSMRDVPWEELGETCLKLEWLAFKRLAVFYDAHRADTDCYVGIDLLAQRTESGQTGLAYVLDAARAAWVRLYACNTPYDSRYLLKKRRYHWNDGENGEPRSWWKDMRSSVATEEAHWIVKDLGGYVDYRPFGPKLRFSARIGK